MRKEGEGRGGKGERRGKQLGSAWSQRTAQGASQTLPNPELGLQASQNLKGREMVRCRHLGVGSSRVSCTEQHAEEQRTPRHKTPSSRILSQQTQWHWH